jgi:hypothetical protein
MSEHVALELIYAASNNSAVTTEQMLLEPSLVVIVGRGC